MDISIGGAWVSPSTAEAFISGSWRSISYGEAYIGGAWRTIANFSPATPPPPGGGDGGGGGGGTLSLSLSTTTLSKTGVADPKTTPTVTVTPSGGLAPYTYAWSILTSDAGPSYSLTAPSYATTAASATGFPLEDTSYVATFHCVVTDGLGVTGTSDTVTATFRQRSGTGGGSA